MTTPASSPARAHVACGFPNGATALAAHYRSHEESWPGGFHRDAEQDQEVLARNPLPPAALKLRDLRVNGHRVTYDGDLAMAFRLDDLGSLIAFAGYNCRSIAIDGREFTFASAPVAAHRLGARAARKARPRRRCPWKSGCSAKRR